MRRRTGLRAVLPRARGRPAATREEWREIHAAVLARAHWHCQACGAATRLDVHHVVKRAQGGSDFDRDQLVALCRRCHAWTDAPYATGRLVVRPCGAGRFTFTVLEGRDKWSAAIRESWTSLWPVAPSTTGTDEQQGLATVGRDLPTWAKPRIAPASIDRGTAHGE